MDKRESQEKLGTMPVGKLLAVMSLPMMISMLVQALYNAVDAMFVARLSEDALTAVSLAFPFQNVMIAGIVAGVGGWDDGAVHHLWVEEPYRNQGIGTWLLQEAEKEMQENGAYMIMVTAFDWAADFFTKRGYAITGVLEDLPQGHREYDLRKNF